jgi:hypothetical protein
MHWIAIGEFLGLFLGFDLIRAELLAEDKMERESVYTVVKCHAFPSAGGVGQLVDLRGARKGLRGALEVCFRFDYEGDAAEGVGVGLGGAVDKPVMPVAAVVDLVVTDTFSFGEAEVEEEFVRLVKVDVGMLDVRGLAMVD